MNNIRNVNNGVSLKNIIEDIQKNGKEKEYTINLQKGNYTKKDLYWETQQTIQLI